jgi:hypothetical protein
MARKMVCGDTDDHPVINHRAMERHPLARVQ